MGIFRNWDQPGPGVYVEETQEGPVVRFFRVLWLKFFTLCLSNMLFLIINIPMIVIAFFMSGYLLPLMSEFFIFDNFIDSVFAISGDSADIDLVVLAEEIYFSYLMIGALFFLAFSLVVIGPIQSAFVFIYRNFARGVQTFYWADFMRSLKTNWKQSIFVSIFTAIVSFVLLLNIGFYLTTYTGRFAQPLAAVFIVVFLIFLCVHQYVYPLLVSLDLSLFKIYRNALIFAVVRLGPTIGILLIQLTMTVIIPFLLIFLGGGVGIAIAVIFYIGFAFSFSHYLSTAFAWEQIDRYILTPAQIKEEEERAKEQDEGSDEEDTDQYDENEEDDELDADRQDEDDYNEDS